MFNNLGQIADLMRNAGKIREQVEKTAESIQAATESILVEGTAGGGAVTAKVNGRLELIGLRIDPKTLADGDSELLEDLIVAAVGQGQAKVREELAKAMQSLTGGIPLPLLNMLSGK